METLEFFVWIIRFPLNEHLLTYFINVIKSKLTILSRMH